MTTVHRTLCEHLSTNIDDQRGRYIVVSYFTKLYAKEWARLERSLQFRGIEYIAEQVASLGNWSANCAIKPEVITSAVKRFGSTYEAVVWLDADAEVIGDLSAYVHGFIDNAHRPIGAYLPRDDHLDGKQRYPLCNSSLMSGTLLFNTSRFMPECEAILRSWSAKCREEGDVVMDQELLDHVLRRTEGVFRIDPRLVCVPDLMPKLLPVVLHHQASRRFQSVVDNGEEDQRE